MTAFIKNRTRVFWLVFGFLLIAVIGSIDAHLSPDIIFAPFYCLPILILAWFVSRDYAMAAAVVSTIMWSAADIYTNVSYSAPLVFYWNNLLILLLFISVAIIISELRLRKSRIDELYVTDSLTGAVNRENFQNFIHIEMDRHRRFGYPFTVVYLDVDGLHGVNESLGRSVGDKVLRTTAMVMKNSLRKTDLVARLGDDEFSLLLPETGQEAAREVVNRIRLNLTNEMAVKNWPLTFSIGILTCQGNPTSADEVIKHALDAMHLVKSNGKDGVCFTTFPTS